TRAAPAQAREAVAELAETLPGDLGFRLRLLVSELVANSVRHGGLAAEQRIRLVALRNAETLRVAVEDDGHGFDVPAATPAPDAEHGRGLDLVDALASRWGVSRTRPTRVWFELALVAAADDPAGARSPAVPEGRAAARK